MITPALDENHIYHMPDTGRVIPGVTSVLQEYVEVEFNGFGYYLHIPSRQLIPAHIMDRAAEFGTAFHLAAKYLLSKSGLNWQGLNPILEPALRRLEEWIKENVREVILVERPLYSPRYDYAGTLDLLCVLVSQKRGHISLVDFKTGLYGLAVRGQTAAYENLYRENFNYRGFIDRYVLYISRDGEKLEFVPLSDKTDFQYFLYKLNAYRWEQGRKAA